MHETAESFGAQAKITEVVDGDTYRARLKVWHNHYIDAELRLSGVDTHEIHFVSEDSEEYKRGMKEMQYVKDWFYQGRSTYDGEYPFHVVSESHEASGTYGRWLVDIHRKSDGAELNGDLLRAFDDIKYDDGE